MANPEAKHIAVVVPVYNEAESLPRAVVEIRATLEATGHDFTLVFVDDGSKDRSRTILSEFALEDPRIQLIALSRNFGKEAALAAGLEYAQGDCLIFMDADLQHPTSVIPTLVEMWEQGYDIVNAKKRSRGTESFASRMFASTFNYLMSGAIGADFHGASDFKLIDGRIAAILKDLPERNRFFRGLVSWVGFKSIDVEFDVDDRLEGDTKWAFTSLLRYTVRNIVSFSNLPLHIVAYAGFGVSIVGSLILLKALFDFLTGSALTGFTTTIGVQILIGGMLLVAIGTISLYIAKMYDEQKSRPMFLVDDEPFLKERVPEEGITVEMPTEASNDAPAAQDPEIERAG